MPQPKVRTLPLFDRDKALIRPTVRGSSRASCCESVYAQQRVNASCPALARCKLHLRVRKTEKQDLRSIVS